MDMAGNTTAWVYDVPRQYSAGPINDPIGEAPKADRTDREMRGGFWISSRGTLTPSRSEIDIKHTTRSELRAHDDPRSSDDHLGFRVVIDYCDR
jgi:formylglycine-generating enzyme required for sulfatase activity